MYGTTYIKSKYDQPEPLHEFAKTMYRILNICDFSRRESDNYFGGEYFVGKALGIKVTIAITDDASFSDYHFWVTYSADGVQIEDKSLFENVADLVARYLAIEAYEVLRDRIDR